MKYAKITIFIILFTLVFAFFLTSCVNTGGEFTITFEENGGSEVSDIVAAKGTLITFPQNPTKSGYTFGGWYYDAAMTQKVNPVNFSIQRNIILYAYWINNDDVPHDITAVENPLGSYSFSKTAAKFGETVEVTVYPDAGYRIVENSVSVTSPNTSLIVVVPINDTGFAVVYRFTMPSEAVTVDAEFELKPLNVNIINYTSQNGSVYCSQSVVTMGDVIQFTVVPHAGYKFLSLYINGSPSDTATYQMSSADIDVYVVCEPIDDTVRYNIDVANLSHGSIEVSDTLAPEGKYIYITPNPDEGYRLFKLYVNGIAADTLYFTMPDENVNISAEFLPINEELKYNLSVLQDVYGTVSVEHERYSAGDAVTVQAKPVSGYRLDCIFVNGVPYASDTFIMPQSDVTVSASFVKLRYSVTVLSSVGGYINLSKTSAYGGEIIGVNVTVNEGYLLDALYLNNSPVSQGFFVMPEGNAQLRAEFIDLNAGIGGTVDFPIAAGEISNGTLILSKNTALHGECVYVTPVAGEGYRYREGSLRFNNIVFQGNRYFIMPASGVTVTAVFDKLYSVIPYDTEKGYALPDRVTATVGETVNLFAAPKAGYVMGPGKSSINVFSVQNSISIDVFQMSFVMPEDDVVIEADFDAVMTDVKYKITLAPTVNGSISANLNATELYSGINAGNIVHLTVTSDPLYRLDSLYYTFSVGGSYDTVYIPDSFVMPESNISVFARFAPVDAGDNDLSLYYHTNRAAFFTAGAEISFMSNVQDIKTYLDIYNIGLFAPYISGVFTVSFRTEFTVFQFVNISYMSHVAQSLKYYFDEAGTNSSFYVKDNFLTVSLDGKASEDFYVVKNGLFKSDKFVYYIREKGTYGLLAYSGTDNFVNIPDTFAGRAVTRIAGNAFLGRSQITRLTMGKIKEIAYNGISALTALKNIDLSSVVTLEDGALKDLISLNDIYVDSFNKNYLSHNGVLYSKGGYYSTLIRYPAGKTDNQYIVKDVYCNTIAPYAFYKAALSEIDISKVANIGQYAFKDCTNLYGGTESSGHKLNLKNLNSIGDGAFENCLNMTYANLEKIYELGKNIFTVLNNNLTVAVKRTDSIANGNIISFVQGGTGKLIIEAANRTELDALRKNSIWSVYSNLFTVNSNQLDGGKYLVMFSTDGGTYIDSQIVLRNVPPVLPEISPNKPGKTFAGWYKDATFTVFYDSGTVLNANTILYAKYE